MFSCQRLSLTSLSYLWQRDQAELLAEMIAAGMEAVLIKVAVCGEGGEYETLTLDCPLFKQRITL